MKKLAIITTHPIQYNAPFFKMLHARGVINVHIFYTWGQAVALEKFDPGFNKNIQWDIDLTEGYTSTAVLNSSTKPGSHHLNGIINPHLIDQINDFAPTAVMVYGWRFKSHWKVLQYYAGKLPVFFRGDSTLLDEMPGIRQWLRRAALSYIYRYVDKAFYVGEANKKYFKVHGLTSSQLLFMPHAIDNSRFQYRSESVDQANNLREANNIPDDACVFLFSGKLEEKKRPAELARCFSELNFKNAYLVFVGSGAQEGQLREIYGKNEKIIFLGFVNQAQMPAIYHACNVLVLPSAGPQETWGLCINEAMASGRAIIASDACGAAQDLIRQEVNGFVFAKNSWLMLKKHLHFCSEHPKVVKQMGRKSLELIKAYNLEFNCGVIENAVNELNA